MNDLTQPTPGEIVSFLLKNDPFSQWMGVDILNVRKGYCKLCCMIREEMLNGFSITHGGIVFSLADTALAFAAATYGRNALAIDNSISFTKKTIPGNSITAESRTVNITHRTGLFEVRLWNEDEDIVAFAKGTVYRTDNEIICQ